MMLSSCTAWPPNVMFFGDTPQIFGGIPCFTVQQKPNTQPHLPIFICQLKIPQLPPGSDGREAQAIFTAEASTKKVAEQSAAEQALGYIRSRGLPVAPPVSAALPAGNQQQQQQQRQQQQPSSHILHAAQVPSSLPCMPQVGVTAGKPEQCSLPH
jgi:Double-stranded RNA binding motif